MISESMLRNLSSAELTEEIAYYLNDAQRGGDAILLLIEVLARLERNCGEGLPSVREK